MPHTHVLIFIFLVLLLATAKSKAVAKSNNNNKFLNQFLAPHNAARSALGMRPLVWDRELARYAQAYAGQRRGDCALRHSNGKYGENIFWGSGEGWTAAQAVAEWAGERKWYNYWSNSCSGGQECGHYTQIVWRNTRKLGCARVNCFRGKGVFITCNYDPPGNFIGQKPY